MAKIWFFQNWMYAGFVAGLFLLAALPLFAGSWSAAMVAVFLMLPAYMVHQVEEHAGDRFRRFVNKYIARVPNALTTPAVVVVNVPLVWGVDLVAIYLARFLAVGWGLIAVYLILVNAVLHIIGAAALRGYNPGLVTALVLFLPLGAWALMAVAETPGVTVTQHAFALAFAVIVHAGLAVFVLSRARRLRAAATTQG
jgi:hypothetical protein